MSDPDDTTRAPSSSLSANDPAGDLKNPGQDKPRQDKRVAREERLAEALRANLKRRKQQQRGRRTAATDNDDARENETDGDS
ncbi:hypothetical protein C8N35_10193 [Breoghania corrubedonensis]|uniref:Uncharacterized protein n=1 Tax=Breoghania corrubedonensis TaxID=665038 RepID=A0A2T5VE74_9HYPH|nr:hypothetical protein [Breoghania corrubedonensis]PTW62059.1 hypothetical protein C8N35_10193 [Breoghania corrubedonensis]